MAADLLWDAPTANLYVDVGDEGTLQMCVMRPSARETCPELPLLVTTPDVPSLAAERGLGAGAVSGFEALEQVDAPDDAPLALRAVEQALMLHQPLPCNLDHVQDVDWTAAFASRAEGQPFQSLGANALHALALAAQSDALCDLLLRHSLPRLLQEQQTTRGGLDTCGDSNRDGREGRMGEALGSDDASGALLPPMLSSLLLLLLRRGTALSLPIAEFERQVVGPLHSLGGMGPCAANQAALVFATEARKRRAGMGTT